MDHCSLQIISFLCFPCHQVNAEGFSAVEDGDLTQRILLSDVSAEAAQAFLNYLYMADTDMPPSLAPDLRSLALRLGFYFTHTPQPLELMACIGRLTAQGRVVKGQG